MKTLVLLQEMGFLLVQYLSLSHLPSQLHTGKHPPHLLFPDSSHYSFFSFSLSAHLNCYSKTPFRIALYNDTAFTKQASPPPFFSQLTISLEYHQGNIFFFFSPLKSYTHEKERERQVFLRKHFMSRSNPFQMPKKS